MKQRFSCVGSPEFHVRDVTNIDDYLYDYNSPHVNVSGKKVVLSS
jgi:hypothetical protein